MKLTRRSMAGALLATAAGASSSRAQQRLAPHKGLRVRKNLALLGARDPDLEALGLAVGRMRADDGPLGWRTQRRVHAAPWGHHNSWRFLPWHRLQLFYLERIVAEISGKTDFAMPYWDWSDDRAPAQFFERDSPLYDETRTITASSRISDYLGFDWGDERVPGDFWSRTNNDFGDFFGNPNPTAAVGASYAGSAEQYGHNLVHVFCGGRMRNLSDSPLDPLFWVHHANVDRQWAIWSRIHGANPYPQAWSAEICTGYVDADGYLSAARRAGECVDILELGFTYDDLAPADPVHQPETWPGDQDPHASAIVQAALQMQRRSSNLGLIFVPPTVLAGLKGSSAPTLDASGLMQVVGMEGYTVSLRSLSIGEDYEFSRDAIFSAPMGGGDMMGMGMKPMGHRLQLNRLVPRDARALTEGFWIEADAQPLVGEPSQSRPQLISFSLTLHIQRL